VDLPGGSRSVCRLEGYRCLVIEKTAPGGQAGSSPKIENYLGFPTGISATTHTPRGFAGKRFGRGNFIAAGVSQIVVKDAYVS